MIRPDEGERAARIGGARAEREDPKLVGAFNGSRVISSKFTVRVYFLKFDFLTSIKQRRGLPVTSPETIVRRRCAALIPYARNARTHSDQQVAQIAASIREFGFTNPVLIDEEDGIIAGAGRVLGAHLLGLDEVPCIVLAHLTPTQCRAYVLADNKLALNAGWDLEMLSLEIGELGEAGFDLSLTGFAEFELGELPAEGTQGLTVSDGGSA